MSVGSCCAWADEPVDSISQRIADMVESHAPSLKGDTIVVFPFPYNDGIKSVEGALLSERVSTALAKKSTVRIVERAQLEKIMEEQRLGATGLVNPATAVRVGQLLGASGFLTGTVTDLGDNIEVHVRLVNTETSENVALETYTTRKTIKTFISPLWSRIEKIQREGKSFKVDFWCDSRADVVGAPTRQIGDLLTLHFKPEQDCYITIFDFTTSGSIHVLYPNKLLRDNHVKKDREYVFPTEESGFKIRVKGPPGIERLKLFATTKDIPLFEEDFSQESFRSIEEKSYDTTRDLEAVLDAPDTLWAEARMELQIEQTLR